jgi:hypothetical protein
MSKKVAIFFSEKQLGVYAGGTVVHHNLLSAVPPPCHVGDKAYLLPVVIDTLNPAVN